MRATNSFNSLQRYEMLIHSKIFRNVNWTYIFVLKNFNIKYSKSFLPFIKIFRALDRDYIDYIWIYDPINDELFLVIEKKFNIYNFEFFNLFSDVYQSYKIYQNCKEAIKDLISKFNLIFKGMTLNREIKWNISKGLNQKVLKDWRISLDHSFYDYFY